MRKLKQPEPFWEVRCHEIGNQGISGLCVGYELGKWRKEALSDYIMEWLPEFCLNSKECEGLDYSNAVEILRKAAKLVYKTENFRNRGEFGEIFLHAAIRSIFNSVPVISKIYYKSSHNDTVKGFDCVHVVGPIDNLELWIGEVKFYKNISDAINDVIQELEEHLKVDFLRDEFILIENKLDDFDEYTKTIKSLISKKNSIDNIFKRICIPVLLTYESKTIQSYDSISEEYVQKFVTEIKNNHSSFFKKTTKLPDIQVHLFLHPLKNKEELVTTLDTKLRSWRSI
ncbi:MAG: DUF1837 domain-containing protein [Tissierellales bacterium]|nr:DUF1837 domain-containing protein [Tissierellales bacterium]